MAKQLGISPAVREMLNFLTEKNRLKDLAQEILVAVTAWGLKSKDEVAWEWSETLEDLVQDLLIARTAEQLAQISAKLEEFKLQHREAFLT